MTEEIFDVVDEADRVIGQAPRSEVHARGLLHRAVHIFVRNTRGQLLVHRRSAGKDEYPSRCTSSASGHLHAGEDYDDAARRELEEELGLSTSVQFLARFPAGPETANEHSWLYETVTDEPPVFDPSEIAEGWYSDLSDVAAAIARDPADHTPPFRTLFAWYHAHRRSETDEPS